jgi:hypothetical protein
MSTLNDTDLFVIERSGTNYQVRSDEMSTLQDTDLFVVERSGTNYQVEAKDINLGPTGSIEQPVSVLTPFNGAGLNDGEAYQPLSTAITAVGADGEVVYSTDTIANVANKLYSSGFVGTPFNPEQAFDNNLSSYAYTKVDVADNDPTQSLQVNFDPPVPYSSIVEVYSRLDDGGNNWIGINGDNSSMQGSGGQRWFTVADGSGTLSSVEVQFKYTSSNGTGSNMPRIYAIRVDGVVLQGTAADILTFPTDNNFDKFEVGEVVQTTSFEETFGASAGDPFYWGKNGTVFDRYVDIPVIPGTSYFSGVTSPGGEDGRTEIYDGNNVMYNAWNDGDGYLGTATVVGQDAATKFIIPAGFTGNVTRLFMVNSAGSVARGTVVFSYDGVTEYTSTDGVINTSITGIDPAGPTITTDGGSWYGADGTGDAGDGRYEPSQEWSSICTYVNNDPSRALSLFFNGQLDQQLYSIGSARATITFPSVVPATTGEIYGQLNGATDPQWQLQINGVYVAQGSSDSWTSIDAALAVEGGLKTISFGDNGSGVYPYIYGVKLGGKLLVDSSVPGAPGATDITKTVTSDASLTFNSDLELANMVGPLSQVDENGNVKTPVTSEITSVQTQEVFDGVVTGTVSGETFSTSSSYGSYNPGWKGAFSGVIDDPYDSAVAGGGDSGASTFTFTFDVPIISGDAIRVGIDNRRTTNGVVLTFSGGSTVSLYSNTSGLVSLGGYLYEYDLSAFAGQNLVSFTVNNVTGYYSGVVAIKSEGFWLTEGVVNIVGPVLNFNAPNPDLQYFQPGDQIGTYPFTASRSVYPQNESYFEDPQNMENCWDGDLNSTGSYMSKVGTGGAYFYFNIDGFEETVSYEETIHVRVDAPNILNSGKAQSRFNISGFGAVNVPGRDKPTGGTGSWISLDVGTLINSGTIEYGGATTMSTASNGTRIYFGSTVITNTFSGEIRKILTQDVLAPIYCVSTDTIANTMTVEPEALQVGETAVGPPLIASADDIEYLDGNTLGVNGVSGTWLAGLHAQGAEVTAHAPSPESIVFTSMNGGTTEFTGTDATLTSRTWTLEKANSATGPWTEVGVYLDSAANDSQDGDTPWDNPALEANTFYQVKVQYDSSNAASVVSTFNTFKTGDA